MITIRLVLCLTFIYFTYCALLAGWFGLASFTCVCALICL